MNVCKIRSIVEWIRSQGKLPRDAYGEILFVDDLMGWFGLADRLTRAEQMYVRKELAALVEVELSLEELRLSALLAR